MARRSIWLICRRIDEVYRTLQKADTVGMFQVESRAQMASLPRNHPEKFYDLVVQVAIIRPGPIVGQMMHPYMRRRQKKEKVTYPHPSLEPVLKRTLGVPLFQEQLLRMAMTVANFSGAEADELRRAVGMRRSWERMKSLEGKLRAGMTANESTLRPRTTSCRTSVRLRCMAFLNRTPLLCADRLCFSVLQGEYLAAFTCAILNNQPMGFYSSAVLVKDAQRHGLRVKPIDVQVRNGLAQWSTNPMDRCRYVWGWVMPSVCESNLLKLSSNLVEKMALSGRRRILPYVFPARQERTHIAGSHRSSERSGWNCPSPRCSLAGGARRQDGRTVVQAKKRMVAG